MDKTHTKDAAEAILLELPSVLGAFVREDINGHPREVHVLVGPGPEPRHLARSRRMVQKQIWIWGIMNGLLILTFLKITISPPEKST